MTDLQTLIKLNHDLCNEIEIFRRNFELCRDRYSAVVKKIQNSKFFLDDIRMLPHIVEKHEVDVTPTDRHDRLEYKCETCGITWSSHRQDPKEAYLHHVENNISRLSIPHLYGGKSGWVAGMYRLNPDFSRQEMNHITSCMPADKKAYREMYDNADV